MDDYRLLFFISFNFLYNIMYLNVYFQLAQTNFLSGFFDKKKIHFLALEVIFCCKKSSSQSSCCPSTFALQLPLAWKKFTKLQNYLQHTALVGGPNPSCCPICQKLCISGEELMEHMKYVHKDPNASGVPGKYSIGWIWYATLYVY